MAARYIPNAIYGYNLAKRFHKDNTWFIITIFLGGITIPLLGYSKSATYDPNALAPENSFFGGQERTKYRATAQGNQPFGANYYQPAPGPMGQPMPGQPMQPAPGPMGQPMQPDLGAPVQPAAPVPPAAPAAPAVPQDPNVPTDGTNTPTM